MRKPLPFWWWMLPLLLLTCWLGARGLDADSLWLDEMRSIRDAGGGAFGPLTLAGTWQRVAVDNPWHTPGFFMILQVWGGLVGWEPPALRALALLVGLLALAWLYRLGSRLMSAEAGLYAAGVLGTSVFFAYQLHELRMYTLLVLETIFALDIYLRLLDARQPRRWLWIGLLIGTVTLVYTHYFGFMPLIAIGLYHLLLAPKNRRWFSIIGAMALAALLYLPWLSVPFTILTGDIDRIVPLRADELLLRIGVLFGSGFPPLLLVIVFAVLARGRDAGRIWFFALATAGAILLTNQITGVLGADRIRYTIPLWVLLALLAALGMSQLRRLPYGWLVAPAALALWLTSGIANQSNAALVGDQGGADTRPFPLHTAARLIEHHAPDGDAVVLYLPDDVPLSSRMAQLAEFYLGTLPVDYILTTTERRPGTADEEARIREGQIEDQQRVWLAFLPGHESASLPEFEALLLDNYARCETTVESSGLRLEQYSASPACCVSGSAAPRARFGDGIALVNVASRAVSDTADELPVTILWALAPDVPPHEFSASLQLIDPEGNKVAQVDYGLPPAHYTCQQAALPVEHLPDADYRLAVSVYAWRTGARLPALDQGSGALSDALLIDILELGFNGVTP